MKIWDRVRERWQNWRSRHNPIDPATRGDTHLDLARDSLQALLNDDRVPATVRTALAEDFGDVQAMLDKIEHGHIHIAVFGRVGVGKSSVLNALLGEEQFSVSPLHGETRQRAISEWTEFGRAGVFLIDTPGINEIDGSERERIAREVASRSDLMLFVVDSDLSESELQALRELAGHGRPMIFVLNKSDRYAAGDRDELVNVLGERIAAYVDAHNIAVVAANPAPRIIVQRGADGNEEETTRALPPDVADLNDRLWTVLEKEGKTLAAMNAGLFASGLSQRVAERVLEARKSIGERLITTYSISKGVAVALNPIAVTDLFAAAVIDAGMVVHLSQVYGLPLHKSEAGALIVTAMTQMAALMGTVWAVHFVSSALKLGTGGVSTLVTAGAQGAVAYYSTYVVGRVAERYLVQGKSWGDGGPKRVVREILDSLDRDSIMMRARDQIRTRLKTST